MKIRTKNKHNLCFNLGAITTLGSIIALGIFSTSVIANPLGKLSDQWYVGGSAGYSKMNPDSNDTTWKTTKDNDISKKVYVGTDISRQFGLEAFWADFGDAKLKSSTGDKGKVHYTAVGANLIYNSPVKFAGLRPIGKLGVAKFTNKDKGALTSKQVNKLTVFGGLGAEFDLTENFTLRSEYEYYDEDISQLSVGVNWSPKYRDHSFISRQNKISQKPAPVFKSQPNVINVYVPPAPKPRPVAKVQRPRVVYKPAPKAIPQYRVIHKTLSGGSNFNSGSSQLTLNGRQALDKLAQDLKQQFTLRSIKVVGHTDSIGSEQSNLSLSYARANSVAAYLASRGVNRQLINTQGLGERSPVANNRTEQGRAQNRRVTITVKGSNRIRVK